jgi:carboxyl-terminal processing protease
VNKHIKRLALVASVSIVAFVFVQALSKPQAIQQILITAAKGAHVSTQTINDSYSLKVHKLFIDRIDPSKHFFIQSDMNRLGFYKKSIDDEILQNTFNFYNLATDIYMERVKQINTLYPKYLDAPLSFSKSEYIETDKDKVRYKQSEAELEQLWRKVIKHQVLTEYLALIDARLATENEVYKSMYSPDSGHVDAELEERARKKVKEDFKQSFKRRLEETEEDKRALYYDSLLGIFDNHTSYFPPEAKEDFDISISGKLEGIGAVLTEKDGFIKIVRIITGSASWRQGELKAQDIILKVGQGNEEPIDIVGMRVKDAVRYIRGKKGTEVRLTVKKPNGNISVISIVRDIVEIEATYAKGAIVKHKIHKERYGYVYLPKFYRDFQDNKGRNTTDDIRKELDKLRESNVDGIVLDLRNNAGGALVDAVDTAGLFFEKGPVVQVTIRNGRSNVLKDKNTSISYDGPLVVLVNSYSASASEILAAALQDYERAIIVGSESSFGKGTVQTFINLDDIIENGNFPFKDLGSLKITIQKFYRVNGGSTQYKGVIPDIILPDNYKVLEVGERHLEHSLPWDTIEPVPYKKWPHKRGNINRIKANSNARIAKSDRFNLLNKHYALTNVEIKKTLLALNLEESHARKERIDKESKIFTDGQKTFDYLKVSSPKGSEKLKSKAKKEIEKEFFDGLTKDLYLDESFNILHDLIQDLK